MMQKISLWVIPKPEPSLRTVVLRDPLQGNGPFITGAGEIDYVCGACGTVLAASVNPNQVTNLVFRCPKCQSYNDTQLDLF